MSRSTAGRAASTALPSVEEQRFASENHFQPTPNQMQHQNAAGMDRSQLASVNQGRPATTAMSRPSAYHQVAQQHAASQPISAADRTAGRSYNPNTREANQDQRIANGLRSGQMTSGEAARAERTQSRIDQQVHNDRVANGGTLTNQEKQQINREQNGASRQIYNDNHNGNTIKPNAVDNREANQQQRVAQGLRSGQETSGEAARSNANQSRRRPAGSQRTRRQWRRTQPATESARSIKSRTRTAGRSTSRSTTTRRLIRQRGRRAGAAKRRLTTRQAKENGRRKCRPFSCPA